MLPSKLNYPEFVPDQLLTSEHLNQLFEYLEEQGRLSRTNLIGIGIVCGLEVKTAADGTSIVIAQGCGVTSEGYLIAVPETTYTSYKAFDAVQDRLYDKFVDSTRTQRFTINELKQTAVEEGTTALSSTFLQNKVVLLFVEILEENSKNCNPNSCDDKGVNVTVSFRPLMIDKANVTSLLDGTSVVTDTYQQLDELKMRRFDVTASSLADTAAIFEAYQSVLNSSFLTQAETLLASAYTTLSPLVIDIYPTNPFTGLANKFKFLHDGNISDEQLLNLQYYYDLFSDVLLAYEELRKVGTRAISLCCLDSNLFPRHLLLDLAIQDTSKSKSAYRHYFIPSPILNANHAITAELRFLFRRIALLVETFFVPPVVLKSKNSQKPDTSIRITPSKYGDILLSEKSIPYYYKVADGSYKLYSYWNYEKTRLAKDKNILSYHAEDYNTSDEEIITPLLYDLEPHNFLRIEGHIGKPYQQAMKSIISSRNKYRLPFDVIALSGDIRSLRTQIRSLAGGSLSSQDDIRSKCHFQDLESLYDTLAAELTCMLCKEMKYFYNLPGGSTTLPAPSSTIPQVTLLKKCDPAFTFTANTLGHQFELFYASIKNQTYISADVFLGNKLNVASNADNIGLALLYYMEKLSETIVSDLNTFDLTAFNTRHRDLVRVAEYIKSIFGAVRTDNTTFSEDVLDHLDALIYACKQAQFTTMYRDYLSRMLYVLMLQKFAFFIKKHPGIQHKAGVTLGGTFILVYHEDATPVDEEDGERDEIVEREARLATEKSADRREKGDFSSDRSKEAERSTMGNYTQTSGSLQSSGITASFSESEKKIIQELLKERKIDPALGELIDELEDGTVIADFFLPYLCCSDCPSINFTITETEQPAEPVTIDIKDKEYCSDSKAVDVLVSPEGGTLSGEGIADGTLSFNPGLVDLQSADQKTVTLTYTKDGQTATLTVVVYQKPTSAFEFKTEAAATEIIFTSLSKFGKKFEWNFGDGGTSEEENPKYSYTAEGSYKVVLKVSNGVCSHSSTKTVDIKKPATKTCFPVMDIIIAFRELGKSNPDLFEVFTEIYKPYPEVEAFFKEFETLAAGDVEKQIDFLNANEISEKLEQWFNELLELVLNSDLQEQATGLYKVLVDLAMYISCIIPEDLGSARITMENVYNLILKHLQAIESSVANFSDAAKELLKQLLEDLIAEEQRIKDNNEADIKPAYLKVIQQLIELMKSFSF